MNKIIYHLKAAALFRLTLSKLNNHSPCKLFYLKNNYFIFFCLQARSQWRRDLSCSPTLTCEDLLMSTCPWAELQLWNVKLSTWSKNRWEKFVMQILLQVQSKLDFSQKKDRLFLISFRSFSFSLFSFRQIFSKHKYYCVVCKK